jgi:hypothetical protein
VSGDSGNKKEKGRSGTEWLEGGKLARGNIKTRPQKNEKGENKKNRL